MMRARWLTAWRTHDINVRSAPQMLEYEHIASRIARDVHGHVLDWGCGRGQVTNLLHELGVRVTAFDYATGPEGAAFVPLELYPRLSVHLSSDPVKLPFRSGCFDAVLSCGVLEHVEHPEASLHEIRRVLVEGGIFYVFKLSNRHSYIEKLSKHVGTYYHGKEPHDRVYTIATARKLLEGNGFAVGEIRYANMLPLNLSGLVLRNHGIQEMWKLNRVLSRIPVVNGVATNIELIARRR